MPPLEALASGLAVVATDSGGVREFLRDRENALLVSPREPRALAKAIRMLMLDSNLRRRLAERGLAEARLFTWESAADKFEQALQAIIGAGNAHAG